MSNDKTKWIFFVNTPFLRLFYNCNLYMSCCDSLLSLNSQFKTEMSAQDYVLNLTIEFNTFESSGAV